ncbi:hypothetical protein DOY81_004171 [Sarcophaga bullata]|nr:hypothetical protein DOY81_004171 [Sarcophaga bullata]
MTNCIRATIYSNIACVLCIAFRFVSSNFPKAESAAILKDEKDNNTDNNNESTSIEKAHSQQSEAVIIMPTMPQMEECTDKNSNKKAYKRLFCGIALIACIITLVTLLRGPFSNEDGAIKVVLICILLCATSILYYQLRKGQKKE